MSIQFAKPADLQKVRAELDASLKNYRAQLKYVRAMFEVLKDFEGKVVSRRISNKAKKHPAFEGCRVDVDYRYGMYHFEVRSDEIDSGHRFSALLGHQHSSSNIVNLERIKESNACYTLNEGRIKRLEEQRALVAPLVRRWNKALKALQAVHEEAGTVEGLEYKLDLPLR